MFCPNEELKFAQRLVSGYKFEVRSSKFVPSTSNLTIAFALECAYSEYRAVKPAVEYLWGLMRL